jgi:eukaryotic-like serine/threonine-protein kinase
VTTVDSPLADALRDRYLLERELGRGGMATVYLARDLRHDRPVALKVLHQELAHALGPERFVREIKVAARLQHPHILAVFDSGTAKQPGSAVESLWFTMPYVAGESLRNRLAREPQLPLRDAVRTALEVADALGYAHGQGIVHRDVKPENILLAGEHCVIADFGVAQALDAAGGERLTETGITFGTPLYMSPEQASAERRLDGRSDIYSLGCVLYEMLAGDPPFTGRTAQAIIARRLSEPVPRLRTLRDVPESVEEVVAKALARSPADRFDDTSQFAQALQAAVGAQPAVPTEPARAGHHPAFRRRILLVVAGGLVAVAVLLGLYRGLRRAPAVTLDRNLLAIAPFDVLDPSLQLWREGLGDILSRSLDAAGPLRTVSPTVALRRWEGRADPASAEARGRRTGAGLVVFGTVVTKGRDSVTLRAGVLDAVSGSGQREVEVSGESARIGELADSLGIRILQALGQSRALGSVRQVSMGSRSLPALKSFLQGEQFYRRGLWDSALARYDQAIVADSGFALALGRMYRVLYWHPPTGGAYLPGEEYSRRSTLYNHGLSPRESLLIVADSFRFAADAATDPEAYVGFQFRSLGALEEAVRRYPEDPEAWYMLGEKRMHAPFPIGTPPATTFEAFGRSIALDSGFAPAFEHMAELATRLGRPELARHYAAAYLSLYPEPGAPSHVRLVLLALDPTQSGAADTARLVDSASVGAIWRAASDILPFLTDSAETQVRLLRKLGDARRSASGSAGWVLDSLMWPQYLAAALAYRGHLLEAYRTNRRLLLDPAASKWSGIGDRFLDLALLGAVPDSVAGPTFARALEPTAPWGSEATPRHLRGIPWWLAHRDTASLTRFAARAAEETRRPNSPLVVLRARLLGATSIAYAALARGDSAGALGYLEAIPDTLCLVDDFDTCFHLHLTLARLLSTRGDDRRAGALLERWRWAAGSSPWFVLSTLERGRVAERLGEREKAIESYRFVTEAWRRPDPELQPYVIEAGEALARLVRTE